jgi:hypothetical protein
MKLPSAPNPGLPGLDRLEPVRKALLPQPSC